MNSHSTWLVGLPVMLLLGCSASCKRSGESVHASAIDAGSTSESLRVNAPPGAEDDSADVQTQAGHPDDAVARDDDEWWFNGDAGVASVSDAEMAVSGEVHYSNWDARGVVPTSAAQVWSERINPSGRGGTHASLDPVLVKDLWASYRRVRSGAGVSSPSCPVDTRVVVVFRTTSNVARWVALGRECPLMRTEDGYLHRLDAPLFRRLVAILGIKPEIVGSDHDPLMAKYL